MMFRLLDSRREGVGDDSNIGIIAKKSFVFIFSKLQTVKVTRSNPQGNTYFAAIADIYVLAQQERYRSG